MGKRSRKRGDGAGPRPPRPAASPPRTSASRPSAPRTGGSTTGRPSRRARLEDAPKAPWSPFPLVELCILLSLVLLVLGFVTDGPKRGVLLAAGFTLVTLASLELAIREHFSGYRSHTALLSGVCALAFVVPLVFLTGAPQAVLLVGGAVVFGLAFRLLRAAFIRRSGGVGFRA